MVGDRGLTQFNTVHYGRSSFSTTVLHRDKSDKNDKIDKWPPLKNVPTPPGKIWT